MPQGPEQLVVRQHERFLCRVAAQVRVAPEVAERLALAQTVGDGAGAVDATIVDCSRGGLGLESGVFFPRGAQVLVRARPSDAAPTPQGDVKARVMRVTMTDRKPTYYLGLAFTGSGPDHDRASTELLDFARTLSTPAPPGAPPPGASPPAPGVRGAA